MAESTLDNIDIFDNRDLLDRSVETYEEDVPLLAQIALGFTPPGLAIDAAETAKYGRDAFRDFSEGEYKSGLINTGIAGLSALGAVPFFGDIAKNLGKKPLKGLLALPPPKSQSFKVGNPIDERTLPKAELRETQNAFNSVHQFNNAEEMFDAAKKVNPNFQNDINKIAGDLNHRTVGNPGETKLSMAGDTAEQEGKLIYSGKTDELITDLDEITGQPLGQIKKIGRIIEKSAQKYGGDINQVTDPIRTRIIVNTAQEAREVANQIGKKYEMIDSGNQINIVGLRDRKLNIRYIDPESGRTMIGEIGVTTLPMHKAAEMAHQDYDSVRSVLREYKSNNPNIETVDLIPKEIRKYYDESMSRMEKLFADADKEIDPSWFNLNNFKKYRYGGQVTSGNSGKSLPMTPNSFSNSGLESFPPLIHSASNIISAGSHELDPEGMYVNLSNSSPSTTTAGSPSQLKYKFPDITSSPKSNIINSYKNKSTFINNIDQPLSGGRKEIM